MTHDAEPGTTEVWIGTEEITKRSIEVMQRIRSCYDLCIDSTGPPLILSVSVIKQAYFSLKSRGIPIRIITEITKENIDSTKELMNIADIRHLNAISVNFVIADRMSYAGSPETEGGNLVRLMVCNIPSFVKQQQYFFELLWDKAVSGAQRIRQLETGVEPQTTEIVSGRENVIERALKELSKASSTLDMCGDSRGPHLVLKAPRLFNKYLELKENGVRVRHILEMTKDNLDDAKRMMEFSELRHLNGLKGYFAVQDSKVFYSNLSDEKKNRCHS